MKKHYFLVLLLIFCCLRHVSAQDVILKVTGEEIKAKVVEISLTQVRYKFLESPIDSVHSLPRAEVFMVTFANGAKEVMRPEKTDSTHVALTPQEMYLLGRKDAKAYYKGKNIVLVSAATTVLFPPALIVLGAVSPKIQPTEVSNTEYLSNKQYVKGYKKLAHQRKIGKVAIGTGVGILSVGVMTAITWLAYINQ